MKRKSRIRDRNVKFRARLLELRDKVAGNVTYFENEALKADKQTSSAGGSAASGDHIADLGSDRYEQDRMLGLMENSEKALAEIDEALERINSGKYGVCEGCSKRIPQARLRALPYARFCVKCQEEQENPSRRYSYR